MEATTLRKLVWEEMLFANMRSSYFAELVREHQHRDKWLRVAVLVASSGAAATALPELPVWAKLAAPILATAGSFWLLLSNYGTMARDAADLHSGWSTIARDYEKLWNDLSSSQAEATYHQIYERAEAFSNAGTKFPNRKKRLEYWLDHASDLAGARYA